MKHGCVVGALAFALASLAEAKDVVWTGGAGPDESGVYYWTNALNWAGSAVPAVSDVVVFSPEGEDRLVVNRRGVSGNAGMRFESGKTLITGGGDSWGFSLRAKTNELYVAEGAEAEDDGLVVSWDTSYVYLKTGKGKMTIDRIGPSGNHFACVEVREGTLSDPVRKSGFSGYELSTPKLIIGKDATFVAGTYNFCDKGMKTHVHIEKGGTLEYRSGWGNDQIGGLTGEGAVIDTTGKTTLTLEVPEGETQVFSGSFNGKIEFILSASSMGTWLLGSTDVLKGALTATASRQLGFLPGVTGRFELGDTNYACNKGYPLHLADADGNPVTAEGNIYNYVSTFQVDGPGSFYVKTAGVTFTNSQVRLTGTLGANLTSGSMSLGDGQEGHDFDFSTIGAIDSASGTIGINNYAPTTFNGKVLGGGGLSVSSPTTFGDFCKPRGQVTLSADMTVRGGKSSPSYITFGASGKTLCLAGGVMDIANSVISLGSGVTSGRVLLDGGTVRFPFTSAGTSQPFGSGTSGVDVQVGAGGGVFHSDTEKSAAGDYDLLYASNVGINRSIGTALAEGTDGGLFHYGYPEFQYSKSLSITGPFEAEGGILSVTAGADLSGSDGFFGHGDLTLRNERLVMANRTTSGTLRLTDADRALHVDGGSMISLRDRTADGTTAAQNVEIGKLALADGAVLVLNDSKGSLAADGGSTVKVTGETVAVSAVNGRVLANVFGSTDQGLRFYFLGYDAEKGFVPLSNVMSQTSFDGVDSTKVLDFAQNSGAWYASPANKKYAVGAMSVENQMTVKLGTNTSLTIGDGEGTAVLMLERGGLQGDAGSCVEFGTAKGLVLVGAYTAGEKTSTTLSTTIKSANGLSIMGAPDNVSFHALALSGINTYSGDTRIGSVTVYARSATCFSTGDVWVLPGDRHGGQVRFDRPLTWENNFHVGGRGIRHSEWDGLQGNGALSFRTNAVVAGSVELTSRARFCTVFGYVTGRVTGVVSGDRLEVMYSPGVIELSGANTYTGGTRVAYAKLALGRGDSAGTGPVALENGTLRFVNAEPIVFTNDVTGTGSIEILGAPVRFTGKAFAALNGRALAKGSAIAFPDVAAGDLRFAAVLSDGTLDLGGADVTFAEVWGSGTVSGGTATISGEIQPGGAGTIGTLAFDRPPVFASGATFVCEDLDGACDKIVVEGGDVALGDLALAFTLIGTGRGQGVATVLVAAEGAVLGEFASVTKTPQKAERAEVEYGASKVDVRLSKGTLLIIR